MNFSLKKFFNLLTVAERRSAMVLVLLMLIGMMLEMLGIGLVIPALSLMTEANINEKYPFLAPLIDRLGQPTQSELIVSGMLVLVAANALKVIFLAFLAWRQAEFSYGLQANLSARLFNNYLIQPYTFHLQHNSAQLIRNITTEVSQFTSAVIAASILITELMVLAGVGGLLLFVEPFGAVLVIATLGVAALIFHRFTHERLLSWGEARQFHDGQRIQHLQQGLGGVKDVKLLGREDAFIEQFKLHNSRSARMSKRENVLQSLPRLWLELLAVVGIAGLVLTMIAMNKPMASIIPTIGLFSAAAFRVMPSVNRVLVSIQGLKYNASVISVLYKEMQRFKEKPAVIKEKPFSFERDIVLDNVGYTYPGASAESLKNVNLTIPFGASVGLIGDSGAGKSTLVDLVLGLLAPQKGQVKVDGVNILENLPGWQRLIGYVPQTIYLTDDTLKRNVAFGLDNFEIDEDAVREAIKSAQLEEFVRDLPDGLDTSVGERGVRISGGQRQRIGIARALYHNPKVLVLDEATSALDTKTEESVMEAVYGLQNEKTIIIIAHRLSTISQCNSVYEIKQGYLSMDKSKSYASN